jgi:hypothetical protein
LAEFGPISYRIPTASSIHAGFKAIRNTAREYHQEQAKLLILLMKWLISMGQKASPNNALRLNEIKHLRAHSYRTNLRPTTLPLARAARRYI